VVAGLTLLVARPASTAPITGADGAPLQDSIAELTSIDVNGHELGLMIRGHNTGNPVLLFLAGGPGGSELGAVRNHLTTLEEDFTMATLDQRGTGTSYAALDPTDTYTLKSAIDDTIATTNHLRERFSTDRVALVGQSWGTILGVLTVAQEPTLYSAFVGVGQMVSPVETDRIFYTDTLAWARQQGQDGLATTLEKIGPPPYTSMLDYETALSYEQEVYPTTTSATVKGPGCTELAAPTKETVVLDHSGHRPLFEQPEEFVDFMTTHVQPVTR
jgi:pimeloyl-ACP methyl ester carboxylesterase